jgi:feruloyl-CoA synthase
MQETKPSGKTPFRPLPFLAPDVSVRATPDGVYYISSNQPLPPAPRSLPHLLREKAQMHPERVWLAQRTPDQSGWRQVSYGDADRHVRGFAQALMHRGVGPDRGLMILSGNSIEHALASFGAQTVGAAATPISPAYSTVSTDFAKLRHCFSAIRPKAIFVQTMEPFRAALGRLDLDDVLIISADGSPGSLSFWELAAAEPSEDVERAVEGLTDASVGKYLFTSGSTGMPKPAPQTQGAMCAQIACRQAIEKPDMTDGELPVMLDWMPWSHISGGNVNFNGCLASGGAFYIDEGRPIPGQFQTTILNLYEVSPQYFGSAPIAFAMLAEAMETDPVLRRAFFSRLQYMAYGGATLSDDVFERLQALSVAETGLRTPLITMYGATETQGVTMVHWELERVGMVGLPLPGVTLKLAPAGDKLEVRVKGPTVMSGYLGLPEKNAEAFDEEGFYRLGDAARFADPAQPEQGLVFDGRVTEDFKLSSGTWVSVGTLRPEIVAACAPYIFDAVVCGQDRPYAAALLWPSAAALQAEAAAAGGDLAAGLAALGDKVEARLAAFNAAQGGSSRRVAAFRILTTPPSLDAGEITDKGYVNQRAAQAARASDVAALFDPAAAGVRRPAG